MKIIQYYHAQPNLIAVAKSDDDRWQYSPIGNNRITDLATGRDVYAGQYTDANGMMTGEKVGEDLKNEYLALIQAVAAHNAAEREAIKARGRAAAESHYSDKSAAIAAKMDRADSDL